MATVGVNPWQPWVKRAPSAPRNPRIPCVLHHDQNFTPSTFVLCPRGVTRDCRGFTPTVVMCHRDAVPILFSAFRGFIPTVVLCHRDAVPILFSAFRGLRARCALHPRLCYVTATRFMWVAPTVAVGLHPRLCSVTATRFMWVAPTDMSTSPRWGSNRHPPFSRYGFEYQRFTVAFQLANQRLLLRNNTVNRRTFFVKI